MECYRIDESGFTGFDLWNAQQRFQGASAIAIEDDDAARLIREHFPLLQAPELKYRVLARRPGARPRLVALLRDLLGGFKSVTFVLEKRFLLALMFIDYAVEPYWYRRGVDFYADGRNYALASLLTMVGPSLLGRPQHDGLLVAFQRAIKEKTPEALIALVATARRLKWREMPEALEPLVRCAPECLEAIRTRGVSTDVAYILLQGLITRMEVMSDRPYCVAHDRSKNLESYEPLLQRLIAHDRAAEFRQTAITTLKFPLKLTSVTQVDSKESPAVQMADVLVGAAVDAANGLAGLKTGGLDPDDVMPLFGDDQFIHLVPSVDFEEQRQFRQGGQGAELIDYFSNHFVDPANT
ncbi:DUF3800 domain-containing protein [Sphingomonas sp. TREG-RG-20F-R18-01]|uniref:DUF3800 domain-containing protein n=1 Tax=Sphingomonas sp. TREG-RG-20F-R18-01 TaxID=2914982 RepID=UPI001F5A9198|nr:DUF3800 domain-containing protein [Sphingomonas sp. TREG-RG-20F-R18-01]